MSKENNEAPPLVSPKADQIFSSNGEVDEQEFTSDNNVSDNIKSTAGLEMEDLVHVGNKNIPKKSNYSKMPRLSRMNQTVSKLQINNLLLKSLGSHPANDYQHTQSNQQELLVSPDERIYAPRTHRQLENITRTRVAREGELSLSDDCGSGSSSHFDGSMDDEKMSNCTEERNFTPGQK